MEMDIKTALKTIIENRDLTMAEMSSVMRLIMTGAATPAQIGGFLVALRMKGETVEEIVAAAQVMRELATPVRVNAPHLVDIVGTGGDSMNTFNISTTSAIVVAAAGGQVAKHGNRSVSSQSGSADVLEALGVKIDLTPEQVAQCVHAIGIGFMFAPQHHDAMKYAIGPRREMGVRTLFNLLGPLTNPANVPNQLMGVFDSQWVRPLAQVLKQLGNQHVLVVHSEDGLDEISIAAPTLVAELSNGVIITYTITPEKFGFQRAQLSQIQVNSVKESVSIIHQVLDNHPGPARDIVSLNAGAAIYAAGLTETLASGITQAQAVLSQGAARNKLIEWIKLTQSF
jgi:anthranilate phosphoribosyltransferase